MRGLWFDECVPGFVAEIGAYTFTDDNISRFSTAFTPVGFHMNAGEAANGLFGRTAASGFHICCGWMVCFVADNATARDRLAAQGRGLPEIGPSPGIDRIRWPHPVFPGDEIAYRNTVIAGRPLTSKPAWGLVTIRAEGHKADGTEVMSFETKVLVARR